MHTRCAPLPARAGCAVSFDMALGRATDDVSTPRLMNRRIAHENAGDDYHLDNYLQAVSATWRYLSLALFARNYR